MTEAACSFAGDDASNDPSPTRPPACSLAELEAQITELAGHINAASYRWLVLIAEFDRREGWADGSTPSCAHWLGWKCGIDAGSAREKVRVARALEGLPKISAAMARGALSYSKVRALTRVAAAETEDTLLMIALHGTAHHIETLVRRYRRAQESCELNREALQQANRGVNWFYDDDGSLVLRARLTAETGAVLVKALEQATDNFVADSSLSKVTSYDNVDVAAVDASSVESSGVARSVVARSDAASKTSAAPCPPKEVEDADVLDADELSEFQPADRSDDSPTLSQRRADALALFAETWLSRGYQSLGGGERQQIVVHVDSETLRDATPGRCEIEGGPSIAAHTAQRLSCDASLVTLVEDQAGTPLDVGRKTRSIPPAIRRALRSRDPGCRFPGCTHMQFLDGHHIRHWAHGGETKLSNLVMLCRFHHRQVHEGRVDVRMLDDGALRFTGPQGQQFDAAAETSGDAALLMDRHQRDGLAINPTTAVTRWCGERLDYHMAVEGLMREQERARRDVSAGAWELGCEDDFGGAPDDGSR